MRYLFCGGIHMKPLVCNALDAEWRVRLIVQRLNYSPVIQLGSCIALFYQSAVTHISTQPQTIWPTTSWRRKHWFSKYVITHHHTLSTMIYLYIICNIYIYIYLQYLYSIDIQQKNLNRSFCTQQIQDIILLISWKLHHRQNGNNHLDGRNALARHHGWRLGVGQKSMFHSWNSALV